MLLTGCAIFCIMIRKQDSAAEEQPGEKEETGGNRQMDRSKNHQTEEDVARIVGHALGKDVISSEPLTAGQCNALYAVTLADASRCVLKVASADGIGLRRGERWLMRSEIAAMRLAEPLPDVPAPRVLFSDDTKTVCSAPYFIMEYVDGELMGKMRRGWTEEEREYWYEKIGRLIRAYTSVTNDAFGIVAGERWFRSLYDFYRDMLVMMLDDAEEYRVDLGADRDSLLERLALSRPSLDAYTVPRLVHYDLWENNLIVRDGEIVGVLDWERAIWSDPLMEERFLRYARHPAMLRGYGQETFSPEERERMLWYDILMDAAFMVDVYTRQYTDDSQYRWGKDLFRQAWNELRNDAAEE